MASVGNALLQSSFRNWITLDDWHAPFAVTLTFRQCATVPMGTMETRIWLTELIAVQNFRHFMNKLNRRIFGRSAMRFGKGVCCIPILEGGGEQRLHYHAMIDCPRPELVLDYPTLIAECWRSTQWGYWQVDCQAFPDDGWIRYITKFRDKPSFGDAIDWMNFRL